MVLTAVLFAGVLSVWAAILYFQIRHAGLTAFVLGVPFVFGFATIVANAFAQTYALYSCVFVAVIAQTIGARVARGVCDGLAPRAAAARALREKLSIAGPIFVCIGIWTFRTDPPLFERYIGAAAVLYGVLMAMFVAMMFTFLLPFSEQFIARANQAREWRERIVDHFQFIAETRWAFSLSGVALIFFALSGLGMRALRVESGLLLTERLAELPLFLLAGAGLLTRNWRLSLALALTLSLLAAIGLWIFARGPLPLQKQTFLAMAILLSTASVPLANIAAAVNRYILSGDEATVAIARGYHDECANAALSSVIFVVPWVVFSVAGAMRLELAISIASLAAAPLIFPALAGAIYVLLPRYRTVDEVFGKR